MAKIFSVKEKEFLLRLAGHICPEVINFTSSEQENYIHRIETFLASKPNSFHMQFKLFLKVLKWTPVLRYFRPFHKLSPAAQNRILAWFQEAPLHPLRLGFWGLKTLVFMGYYGNPRIHSSIHYTPSQTGNDQLHA